MSFFSLPITFQDMTTLTAEELNEDFQALLGAANSLQQQINSGVAAGVDSVNGLSGVVGLDSPDGTVVIAPSGNNLNFSANVTAVKTLNGLNGPLALSSADGSVAITPSGSNINLAANVTAVKTLNGQAGALNLTSTGGTVTITPGAGTLDLESAGSTPTILNAATFNYKTTNTGTANVTAMANIVTAAMATQGAIINIPAGVYQHTGTVTINGSLAPGSFGGMIFNGASTGAFIVQTSAVDTFNIVNTGELGPANNGGIRFRNLTLKYSATGIVGAAINCADGSANVVAESCYFVNCPQAFICGVHPNSALYCGLDKCTVYYNGSNNSTQIHLSAAQSFLNQCVIHQQTVSTGGPTGVTGVLIDHASEIYLSNNHISSFTTGINISSGADFVFINNCEVDSLQNSIVIAPLNPGDNIQGVFITSCYLPQSHGSTLTGTTGILIQDGGTPANVGSIFITDVLVTGFDNAGINVAGGQNINIKGGQLSSNGQAPTSTALGAALAISGGDTVRAVGVDMSSTFNFLPGSTQPFGVYFSNGCTNAWILNCDLTGNTLPVGNSGQGAHCYVKECRNYNNLNTLIVSGSGNVPASLTQFDATTAGSTPHFGDYLVTWAGGTLTNVNISHDRSLVDSKPTGLTTPGALRLNAQQSMSFTYSVVPTSFDVFAV